MWKAIRQFLYFRMGQKMSRQVARKLGFGTLASVVGIIGGIRMMRRQSY